MVGGIGDEEVAGSVQGDTGGYADAGLGEGAATPLGSH